MGEHHLQPIVPSRSLAPDREEQPTDRSGTELTRLNSDSYSCSSIAVRRSKDLPSRLCLDAVQSDWTDDKHRLYLDSLETSFVKELHQRMHLRSLCSQQKINRKPTKYNIPSSQLMGFQDASWKNVQFERNDPSLDSTADSPAIMEDLWTNHFASAGKQCTLETSDLLEECGNCSDGRSLRNMTYSNGFTKSSQQFSTDSVEMTTEVSGQNFRNNHRGELSSRMPIAKRFKKSTSDSSSNDQVVPFRKLSSERERQNANTTSSEHPENSGPPKSDLCYYLRGS